MTHGRRARYARWEKNTRPRPKTSLAENFALLAARSTSRRETIINRNYLSGVIISLGFKQQWGLDALGNWDEFDQVVEERLDADTDPVAQYVWHPHYIDALAVRYYDADTDGTSVQHYYTYDANFNVTAVLQNDGTVLERYHYTPYGGEEKVSGTVLAKACRNGS